MSIMSWQNVHMINPQQRNNEFRADGMFTLLSHTNETRNSVPTEDSLWLIADKLYDGLTSTVACVLSINSLLHLLIDSWSIGSPNIDPTIAPTSSTNQSNMDHTCKSGFDFILP